MTAYEEVVLRVPVKIAERIQKEGIAEVVFRQKNARLQNFIKCALKAPDLSKKNSEILDTALKCLQQNLQTNASSNSMVKQVLNEVDKANGQLTNLVNGLQNVTGNIESLENNIKSIHSMSFLNAGLSAANLLVTVAGFCIVAEQLHEMDSKLQNIDKKLDDLKNINKNEIVSNYHTFTIYINRMADKEKHSEEISLHDREKFLDSMNEYMIKLIGNINDGTLEISLLSEIVYSLLIPYAHILGEYVKQYYLTHQELPSTLTAYEDPFKQLLDERYSNAMFEYWYFKEDNPNRTVMNAMAAQKLGVANCLNYVQDQIKIVKAFNTEKDLNEYYNAIDTIVENDLNELEPTISEMCGVDINDSNEALQYALNLREQKE